ncbi:MAG: cytochrome c oxidase subunit II [Acidimicrobiia bacterium]
MKSRTKGVAAAILGTLGLVLSGCAKNAPQDTFKPEGPYARKIDNLINPIYLIACLVGLIVFGAVVFVIFKYRDRPERANELPAQIHGNTRLEVMWTLAPAVLLLVIAVPTLATIFDLAEEPKDAVVINVIGQQWWWEFQYPNIDGKGTTVVTANDMVIPAGVNVKLNITSRDVIHSFWLPRLNGKRDAVPNRIHPLTVKADEPGEFWGQCAEFCGLSHANMRIRSTALSAEDWDAWVANQIKPAAEPTTDSAKAGLSAFNSQCAQCHQINGVNQAQSVPLVAGAAPNLTHLMSRTVFAGAMFDLKKQTPECAADTGGMPTGTSVECLNETDLRAWLRNPPGEKPMAATENRGMPNLNLTEQQIDDLVAYLSTLK